MAAAPRADPLAYFTPAQWAALTQRSRWRGLWLVAHCWGVIGLGMWAGARWPWLLPRPDHKKQSDSRTLFRL